MCETYRIPHSEFLSWDADDRHKAVMHQIRKAERCPGCGVHPDELDPRKGGHPAAFTFELHTCEACAAKADGEKELQRRRDEPGTMTPPSGTTVRLKRREEVRRG